MLKKLLKNQSGFSLTEVMIGIMILTVAIVAATNLLVGLVRTNQNNLTTLQAYYLAQEGIEAVRNIRDTNWLHNREWLGAHENLWGPKFEFGNDYAVNIEFGALNKDFIVLSGSEYIALDNAKPWSIASVPIDVDSPEMNIVVNEAEEQLYMGPGSNDDSRIFKRRILIRQYPCDQLDSVCVAGHADKYVLVGSRVTWDLGAKEREVTLWEVLTDWKGGAL